MGDRIRSSARRPSPAMVVSLVALFVALSGASYAALAKNSVGTKQLRPKAVRSVDVKDNSLKGKDINESTLTGLPPGPLADGSVTTAKLADDAVTRSKIADGSVNSPRLSNSSVTAGKIAANAVNAAEIADGTVGVAELGVNTLRSSKAFLNVEASVDFPAVLADDCTRVMIDTAPLNQVAATDEVLVTAPGVKPDQLMITAGTDSGVVILDACAIGVPVADPDPALYEITVIQS